ncbi:OsmC family protein [Pedobacter cryophilus]|uniref:OsmC family protein n=1 Tax=Pedobacter cryophilus TaxID=2571271 RepID=A0A4U1CB28_9SPHI|nr:OsmC family protein [Pedobacter cryophilus]TKC00908.1 OsmC family protein [Pedobacter cryophilus]
MSIKRNVTAVWTGTGLEGKGTLKSANNFFNETPYSSKNRFQNEDGILGTNPEELIAAAHSGCFAMALSFAITEAGFTPDELKVTATVTLDKVESGYGITGITLQLQGKVTGLSEEKFKELAEGAKTGCPVSKALSAIPITLETTFVS